MRRPSIIDVAALAFAVAASALSVVTSSAEDLRSWTLAVFVIPVLLAGLPIVVPVAARQVLRVAAAFALLGFVVLSLPSVGLLFLPAAVVMVVAAALRR